MNRALATQGRPLRCKGCKGGSSWEGSGAICAGCGACPNELRNVNVQLAPGFVVQQKQEVPSEERCRDERVSRVAEIAAGSADGDVGATFARLGEQKPGMVPGDVVICNPCW